MKPSPADQSVLRAELPGDPVESIARLEAERDRAAFNLQLEQEKFKRLQTEIVRLETDLLQLELDNKVLLSRLQSAEGFARTVRTSRGWRLLERLRSLVGRRWD